MSRYDNRATNRAVALKYEGEGAPVVVASGMGYLAERMVEVASESGVPVYEDNSLATMLSQLALGQEIPDALYQAIVEIYVYFLNFDPNDPDKARRERAALAAQAEQAAHPPSPEEEKGES
jgi:flagellar biosynthesis protein